ncbi:protein NODULATION SIGNALING PATHWAY 2-like [Phoenix dactylifera]|uniref:Protein NODULATION SIGNALING PATHWAY 2-like n=1 Tax=Phoenix dactylifera TaxID=42345 RepID=A0A8B7BMN1_PHODC|nr:protein NODULATION SIGNALING PATHWAY 2-like [Phoenix dactylifera]
MEYEPSYGQCSLQANEDIIFPLIMHDVFPDDGHMDTGFPGMSCGDEPLVHDAFMGLQKSLPSGSTHEYSSQQEILVAIRGELMEENSLADLLLASAKAVETENWHLASTALARLDQLLLGREMDANPLNQLAYYLAQGLRARTNDLGANDVFPVHSMASDGMSAYQMLQELSPYVKFGHFAANQAILEATEGDREVRIVDLDVMEGIQWPPLMVDLASRIGTSLWITALVEAGNVEAVHRTGRRLVEFADSIGLPLRFDCLQVNKEGDLERVEAGEGSLVINCMVNQLQRPSRSFKSLNFLLGGARKLRPKLVVLVEEDLFSFGKGPFKSFVEFFCEALHHFSAIFDSLNCSFVGDYRMGLRLVEREMLGPRIVDSVGKFLKEMEGWGGGFSGLEGFRTIPLSSCNVSQAKFLVGLFGRGYGVQHEKGRLALSWKSRPLTTVSILVPA